ncbi:MAG: ROK family protein [Candidatus Lokiarchaeota archaeon]|nr:ROK family protein [Candidatus Lokiarchaeota archaeon]
MIKKGKITMTEKPTIGLDIGGTKIRGGIVDRDGNLIEDPVIIKLPEKRNRETFEKSLFSCLNEIINQFQKIHHEIDINIGIGSAGPLSPIDGVLHSPTNIGCGEYSINERIMDNFPVEKVSLINDCEAIALGYYKFGGDKNQGMNSNALGLIAPGTGLGAAMILNGKPYWGTKNTGYLAVELSQTPYFGSNKKEIEAGIGVNLEDFASGYAVFPILRDIFGGPTMSIISKYLSEARKEDKAWLIEQFARESKSKEFKEKYPDLKNIDIDEKCLLTYRNLGKHLGYAIAAFVTNFNPEILILEGSIMNAYDLFNYEMTNTFRSAVYERHKNIPIVVGLLDNSGIKGSSYWVRV